MAKHFHLDITDTRFHFARKEQEIAAEAARDGLSVIRTSLPDEACGDAATVRIYKSLAQVERAFRLARAARSPRARRKEATRRCEDGSPVHSFHTLIADLATLARNTATTAIAPNHPFTITPRPTPAQQKAFDLLGVTCSQ